MFVLPFGVIVAPLVVMWYLSKFYCSAESGSFFCILHNILLVCPHLCWYYVPWQCLINFFYSTRKCSITASNVHTPRSKWLLSALVNDWFLPAMCTPQNKWIKRARSVLEVLCASPQAGLCHIQDLWPWHGGALHVWASRLINHKRLLLVSVGINIIWSVGNEHVKLS